MRCPTKFKGGTGEAAVTRFFMERGFPVFGELFCDVSTVDLVIDTPDGFKGIQVKTTTSKDGYAQMSLQHVHPGSKARLPKNYRISSKSVDLFALYVEDRDTILFIDASELDDMRSKVRFRFEPPANNQCVKIRLAQDYLTPSFI